MFAPFPAERSKTARMLLSQHDAAPPAEALHLVYLKRLRHPLLQAAYLRAMAEARQGPVRSRMGADPDSPSGGREGPYLLVLTRF